MLHCPLREIRAALSGYGTAAAKSSDTRFYQCVQYFRVSKQWCGCQCLGFFNVRTAVDACDCTRGLYGHCERLDLHRKLTGRKLPCSTGDSNPRQYCAWLCSRALYPLSYPCLWLQPVCCVCAGKPILKWPPHTVHIVVCVYVCVYVCVCVRVCLSNNKHSLPDFPCKHQPQNQINKNFLTLSALLSWTIFLTKFTLLNWNKNKTKKKKEVKCLWQKISKACTFLRFLVNYVSFHKSNYGLGCRFVFMPAAIMAHLQVSPTWNWGQWVLQPGYTAKKKGMASNLCVKHVTRGGE